MPKLATASTVWIVLAAGCSGALSSETSTADGGSAFATTDAGLRDQATPAKDASEVACTLDTNGSCGVGCCAAARGWRVDRSRICYEAEQIALGCTGPDDGCTAPDAEGCLVRLTADGGQGEVFITPQLWTLEGFEECSNELRAQLGSVDLCQ